MREQAPPTSPVHLPYISRTSPVHLPYISRTSPVHLPYISPSSPVHLPYISPACASRRCVADCSGHGTCGADGACRCEAGWRGPPSAPCSVQGTGCPNGCSHHGRCVQAPPISPTSPCISPTSPLYLPCISHHDRCVQGNCACHHGYVGRDCAQARPLPLSAPSPLRPLPPLQPLPTPQPRADTHRCRASPPRATLPPNPNSTPTPTHPYPYPYPYP